MQLDVLARNRAELLACAQLLPHVRDHLELRLRLLDESSSDAWDRLMEHGRELGDAYANSFNTSLSDALVEAAARGGAAIGEKALAVLDEESATEDWREIFAVRVLGAARYEPAIDTLVEKLTIDTDVLREDVDIALSRIGTSRAIDRLVDFFPGKPWHVRLYTHVPLARMKRPESEDALMKLLAMELELEKQAVEDEGPPLIDALLLDLTELCSLSGLERSRRYIAEFPDDGEADDLCHCLLATAVMNGVALPEEAQYRKRIRSLYRRLDRIRPGTEKMFSGAVENWRKTGIRFPAIPDEESQQATAAEAPAPDYQPVRVETIRNTVPKVGRNDPCPCGSGKKFKKCCWK